MFFRNIFFNFLYNLLAVVVFACMYLQFTIQLVTYKSTFIVFLPFCFTTQRHKSYSSSCGVQKFERSKIRNHAKFNFCHGFVLLPYICHVVPCQAKGDNSQISTLLYLRASSGVTRDKNTKISYLVKSFKLK